MNTDRELMQQALEALKLIDEAMPFPIAKLTIKILRERLAQPEQELVIDCPRCGHCCPQRKPLTDEEIDAIADEYLVDYRIPAGCALNFARDIEAAHGIKGS